MGVARRGLDVAVPEQLANRQQGLAERQGTGREAVSQVMDSHVVEVRAGAYAAPGVLNIGQMGPGFVPTITHG